VQELLLYVACRGETGDAADQREEDAEERRVVVDIDQVAERLRVAHPDQRNACCDEGAEGGDVAELILAQAPPKEVEQDDRGRPSSEDVLRREQLPVHVRRVHREPASWQPFGVRTS